MRIAPGFCLCLLWEGNDLRYLILAVENHIVDSPDTSWIFQNLVYEWACTCKLCVLGNWNKWYFSICCVMYWHSILEIVAMDASFMLHLFQSAITQSDCNFNRPPTVCIATCVTGIPRASVYEWKLRGTWLFPGVYLSVHQLWPWLRETDKGLHPALTLQSFSSTLSMDPAIQHLSLLTIKWL